MNVQQAPIRILLLADPASVHTLRWYHALRNFPGLCVGLVGMRVPSSPEDGLNVRSLLGKRSIHDAGVGVVQRASMLVLAWWRLWRIVRRERPTILHAHYLSSYGLLAALVPARIKIVSAWGSDVYVYPKSRWWRSSLLRFVLWRADYILSTSKAMAGELAAYTTKPITITPFGIDLNQFFLGGNALELKDGMVTIGIVKSIKPVYGIDTLIRAMAIVSKRRDDLNVRLIVIGGGSEKEISTLKTEAERLGISEQVDFLGECPHNRIHQMHQLIDIACYPSHFESFGVSILESSASGRPVIVSDVGGLPEVVVNGKTGLVVPVRNEKALADAILRMIERPEWARELGQNGRRRVEQKYDWQRNVKTMVGIYQKTVALDSSDS
ncbi:glycosyltransferase [Gammaproteobacteria bacterium]|nr:glycosyltransferase [Gammaproteobacteria bacterium]